MITRAIAVPYDAMKKWHEGWLYNDSVIIISITGTDDPAIFDEETSRVLPLKFDDITPIPILKCMSCKDMIVFDIDQANAIIDFIHRYNSSKYEYKLIVNCMAGICRSGAVVSFAQLVCQIEDLLFVADNPNILPNEWVFNLLVYQYLERERKGEFD